MIRLTLGVHDLPKLDRIGWCDPYVEVLLDDEHIHSTQVLRKTTDAIWNDFPLENVNSESILKFIVRDHDRFDSDDFIGEAELSLDDLIQQSAEADDDLSIELEKGGFLTIQISKMNMNLQVVLEDLADTDGWFGGTTDAYFIAYVNGVEIHKSEVIDNSEHVIFTPFPATCDSFEDELSIKVLDEDHGEDDLIGQANFTFEEIMETGKTRESVYNQDGELMAKITVIGVEKLRQLGAGEFDGDLKPDCAEREQETFYELECRVQDGGFHGAIYIMDNLGKPGRWLNNVLFAGKKSMKLFICESCIYTTDVETDIIDWVAMFDNHFQIERKDNTIYIDNLDRRMRVQCEAEPDAEELEFQIRERVSEEANPCINELIGNVDGISEIENGSFALPRPGTKARWFVQGRDYYWYLAEMIQKATKEIYITDWWMSPEVELKRPKEKYDEGWRLEELIMRKAEEGVMIYIQLFSSLGERSQLKLGAPRIEDKFNPFPNIQVMKHGAGLNKLYLWSHHEKVCVIDQCVAFVGGIDLCANRYDDPRYLLLDTTCGTLAETLGVGEALGDEDAMIHGEDGQMFPGKDYLNSFVAGAENMEDWDSDLLERGDTQRMPWQDIAGVVYGKAAFDVGRHFIQRWNFTKMQQAKSDETDPYSAIRYILPLQMSKIDERIEELDFLSVDPEENHEFSPEQIPEVTAQVLRSFCNWSGGTPTTEHSIQNAYIKLIEESQNFIYIENQFFVTTVLPVDGSNKAPQSEVANRLGQCLVDRIKKAHENEEDFKIYIIIPLMPEFNGDIFKAETEAATLKTIMHYQYASINKDSPDCAAAGTIYTQLQAEGIDPNEYIHFGALRAWQQATSARAVTELIYVHSKLMIVDDKYTIIGSANFNDRSQEGNRDSEMCILYTDDDEVDPENSFARTLQ